MVRKFSWMASRSIWAQVRLRNSVTAGQAPFLLDVIIAIFVERCKACSMVIPLRIKKYRTTGHPVCQNSRPPDQSTNKVFTCHFRRQRSGVHTGRETASRGWHRGQKRKPHPCTAVLETARESEVKGQSSGRPLRRRKFFAIGGKEQVYGLVANLFGDTNKSRHFQRPELIMEIPAFYKRICKK